MEEKDKKSKEKNKSDASINPRKSQKSLKSLKAEKFVPVSIKHQIYIPEKSLNKGSKIYIENSSSNNSSSVDSDNYKVLVPSKSHSYISNKNQN
jgi:hypothetical protein